MGYVFQIRDQSAAHFVTFTVHQWIDVFTRNEYKDIIINSLQFCQKNKGLEVYSWVIMSNHIHLIIRSSQDNLSDIIRDFKKFTAAKVIQAIENNPRESRKRWLLWLLKKEDSINFWQDGYHGEEVYSRSFYQTKENYIHQNPVRAGIVMKEEEYLYSSAPVRYGLIKGQLDLNDFD